MVGAAALALIAAIVLPMVMDQEPGSPAQDIQVTIPDREADSALARPIASRPTQSPEPQLAPPPEEQSPGPVPPEAPVRPATAPAADGPASSRTAASAAVTSSMQKPSEKSPEPVGKAVVPPLPVVGAGKDAARAQAILEGKAVAQSAVPASESFVVQVGAFSDIGKAASIAADLKKRGFTAYTEKVGAVTRVRVGPFRGREDAEKVAQRVRASGMNGSVMAR
nr:SPOR domain-containing protein [Aromatoleum diolicum]